jgi:hypothetical protein
MMNQELVDTARLLVAAVQDSDGFTTDYLRKLIIHLVPQLLGEIEILANVATSAAGRMPVYVPEAPAEKEEAEPTRRKDRKKDTSSKKRRKKRR